ncbi:hypothetical protein D3C87_941700 [compost metagenome]
MLKLIQKRCFSTTTPQMIEKMAQLNELNRKLRLHRDTERGIINVAMFSGLGFLWCCYGIISLKYNPGCIYIPSGIGFVCMAAQDVVSKQIDHLEYEKRMLSIFLKEE